jgi:hypothetical protein
MFHQIIYEIINNNNNNNISDAFSHNFVKPILRSIIQQFNNEFKLLFYWNKTSTNNYLIKFHS